MLFSLAQTHFANPKVKQCRQSPNALMSALKWKKWRVETKSKPLLPTPKSKTIGPKPNPNFCQPQSHKTCHVTEHVKWHVTWHEANIWNYIFLTLTSKLVDDWSRQKSLTKWLKTGSRYAILKWKWNYVRHCAHYKDDIKQTKTTWWIKIYCTQYGVVLGGLEIYNIKL